MGKIGKRLTILVDIPFGTIATENVHVGIYQGNSLEILCAFDGGPVVGIADELSVVILNDGGRNNVGTGREVNDSTESRGRATLLTTTFSISNGIVDGFGIVC